MLKHFLFDVHTHTNIQPLINDLPKIIECCKKQKIIWNCVGTNLANSKLAIEQAKKYKKTIYAIIGIHPSEIDNIDDIKQIENLYLQNKDVVVAIGEIGLDYYQNSSNKQQQITFFHQQLLLANKYDLPVCIHVRNAEDDCLEILKIVKNPKNVWIHCFTKNIKIAKKYIERGYMLSIPGVITFKNALDLQNSVKTIPLDHLMIETDGPFLAPTPHRGETNFPYYLPIIFNCLAHHLQINDEQLAKQLLKNSVQFFKIKI